MSKNQGREGPQFRVANGGLWTWRCGTLTTTESMFCNRKKLELTLLKAIACTAQPARAQQFAGLMSAIQADAFLGLFSIAS